MWPHGVLASKWNEIASFRGGETMSVASSGRESMIGLGKSVGKENRPSLIFHHLARLLGQRRMAPSLGLFLANRQDQASIHSQSSDRGSTRRRKPNNSISFPLEMSGPDLPARVKEITPDEVIVGNGGGEKRLPARQVFALTGYHPDFAFIQRLGVWLDPETRKPALDPNTLESNVPGIHLAGVVIGGRHTGEIFIENGRFHGKQIVDALAAKS